MAKRARDQSESMGTSVQGDENVSDQENAGYSSLQENEALCSSLQQRFEFLIQREALVRKSEDLCDRRQAVIDKQQNLINNCDQCREALFALRDERVALFEEGHRICDEAEALHKRMKAWYASQLSRTTGTSSESATGHDQNGHSDQDGQSDLNGHSDQDGQADQVGHADLNSDGQADDSTCSDESDSDATICSDDDSEADEEPPLSPRSAAAEENEQRESSRASSEVSRMYYHDPAIPEIIQYLLNKRTAVVGSGACRTKYPSGTGTESDGPQVVCIDVFSSLGRCMVASWCPTGPVGSFPLEDLSCMLYMKHVSVPDMMDLLRGGAGGVPESQLACSSSIPLDTLRRRVRRAFDDGMAFEAKAFEAKLASTELTPYATFGASYQFFGRPVSRVLRTAQRVDRIRLESIKSPEAARAFGSCLLCSRTYQQGMEVRVLPCGHRIHKPCFDSYVLEAGRLRCPVHNENFRVIIGKLWGSIRGMRSSEVDA